MSPIRYAEDDYEPADAVMDWLTSFRRMCQEESDKALSANDVQMASLWNKLGLEVVSMAFACKVRRKSPKFSIGGE